MLFAAAAMASGVDSVTSCDCAAFCYPRRVLSFGGRSTTTTTSPSLLFAAESSIDDDSRPDLSKNAAADKDDQLLFVEESDVIRMLRRRSPRYNNDGSQQTALDVLYLLSQVSSSPPTHSSLKNMSKADISSLVESTVDDISPNIASAALRRLCSPPFLPSLSQHQHRNNNYHKWNQMTSASTIERNVYDQLMQLLLEKISSTLERQSDHLASTVAAHDNTNRPTLLPHSDSWILPPTSSNTGAALNWYALADLLYSLSSLCNCEVGTNAEGYLLAKTFLPQVIEYVSWDNKMTSSFVRCIGPRRLVGDVAEPLARLAQEDMPRGGVEWMILDDFDDDHSPSISHNAGSHSQLMAILSSYLVLPHSLEKLTASHLSTTLQSMTKILHPLRVQQPLTLHLQERILLRTFMKRLRKHSVRASASPRDLVKALSSVTRLIGCLEEQDQKLLLLSPLRPENNLIDDLPTGTLRGEAVIMAHTLMNDIVNPPYSPKDMSGFNDGNNKNGVKETKLHSLSLNQITDILEAVISLKISPNEIAVAVAKMLSYLTLNPTLPVSVLQQCRSCRDIARILLVLHRLRVGSGIFDDMRSDNIQGEESKTDNAVSLEKKCVQMLGERFLGIALWRKEQSKGVCDAKTLASVLRSGVLMFHGKSSATKAMLDAASMLILDNTRRVPSSFLLTCNEFEVSNYLFAFALAKRFDKDVFSALTNRMMDDDILDICSAGSASRAMWSVAKICSLNEAGKSHIVSFYRKRNEHAQGGEYQQVFELFDRLAPVLLLPLLSPTDTSMAMWAMAKAEYVEEKGIFDHLAQALASEEMLQRSNTRLISQAMWSCGKMATFEGRSSGDSTGNKSDSARAECIEKYLQVSSTMKPYFAS